MGIVRGKRGWGWAIICMVLAGWGVAYGLDGEKGVELSRFKEEMVLADKGPDRDTRLVHLRRALELRPEHPDNLAIEYRIGIELSQRYSPKFPEQKPKRAEGLAVFERILKKYNHMDYYGAAPVDSSSSMQLMVVGAAQHASQLQRALNGDRDRAREELWFAMDCIEATFRKRVEDWRNEPKPRKESPWIDSQGKDVVRLREWEERKRMAEKGDVFGPLEMSDVRIAVTNLGETYGSGEAAAMALIVERYPGTPLAAEAQRHIERALGTVVGEVEMELPEMELDSAELEEEPVEELEEEVEAPVVAEAEVEVEEEPAATVEDAGPVAEEEGAGPRRWKEALALAAAGLLVAVVAVWWRVGRG